MGSRREHTSGTVGGIEVTLGGAFGNITPPPTPGRICFCAGSVAEWGGLG